MKRHNLKGCLAGSVALITFLVYLASLRLDPADASIQDELARAHSLKNSAARPDGLLKQ